MKGRTTEGLECGLYGFINCGACPRRWRGLMESAVSPSRFLPCSSLRSNDKCLMNARSLFQRRLCFRSVLAGVLTTALALVHVLAASGIRCGDAMWRTAAILAPVPLAALVMACVSPAASSDDHSPVLERYMQASWKQQHISWCGQTQRHPTRATRLSWFPASSCVLRGLPCLSSACATLFTTGLRTDVRW